MGAAWALVGANVESEIRELHTVAPRNDLPAPDLDAVLVDDRRVRIEICTLVDEREQVYVNVLAAAARRTNAALAACPGIVDVIGSDAPIYVRFYDTLPMPQDISMIAQELTALVIAEGADIPRTSSMRKVGQQYPTLHRVGTHWTRLPSEEPVRVEIDVMQHLFGRPQPGASISRMFAQKAANYSAYADDGVPIWLVMYVQSRLSFAYGDVEAIVSGPPLDPAPFDRVIVGALTIGTTFERAGGS